MVCLLFNKDSDFPKGSSASPTTSFPPPCDWCGFFDATWDLRFERRNRWGSTFCGMRMSFARLCPLLNISIPPSLGDFLDDYSTRANGFWRLDRVQVSWRSICCPLVVVLYGQLWEAICRRRWRWMATWFANWSPGFLRLWRTISCTWFMTIFSAILFPPILHAWRTFPIM